MGWILFFLALCASIVLYFMRKRDARDATEAQAKASADHERRLEELRVRNQKLVADNMSLRPFQDIRDTAAEAARLREEAQAAFDRMQVEAQAVRQAAMDEAKIIREQAQAEAEGLRKDARAGNADARRKAEELVAGANERAARLVTDAEARAQEIAGDAYRALNESEQLAKAATAMRNVIEGYGDRYLKPTYSLLDQLAENYGFDEAGRSLKQARANSQSMVDAGRAAACDYVERNRRETAVRFVLDAFNGKVDTILGRVKSDNMGTLEQQVRDAYSLVNHNGGAFRDARITPEYLGSRLDELKWAASVVALREREKEEQRQIRERMREEERARREIEKALRDAAKEEEALQKAMAKVHAQVVRASEEQRAAFEAQLEMLQVKLSEAEERNQRALSMAQQTKAGHVYVISNIGSFGEHVFKVGMTRRLEPADRVRELGDASVPFPFDVHAMIWADDAPALEHALHKQFLTAQINKVNPRKEFFRLPVTVLRDAVEKMGLNATWTLTADASQYRETLSIERELAARTEEAERWLRDQLEVTPEQLAPEVEEEQK